MAMPDVCRACDHRTVEVEWTEDPSTTVCPRCLLIFVQDLMRLTTPEEMFAFATRPQAYNYATGRAWR